MNNLRNKIKFVKSSFFLKIFIYFLIIISIILIVSIITFKIYISYYENNITGKYKNSLDTLKKIMDTAFMEINNKIYHYIWSDRFKKFHDSNDLKKEFPFGDNSLGVLPRENNNENMIHSIFFINLKYHQIISNDKVQHIEDFFSYHYPEMHLSNDEKPLIHSLDPIEWFSKATKFKLNISDEKNVIPLVFYYKGIDKNAILLNINETYLYHIINRFKLTQNSEIFIIDYFGNILSTTCRKYLYTNVIDKEIISRINIDYKILSKMKLNQSDLSKINTNRIFKINFFGKKYLALCNQGRSSWPYYLIMIPLSDIYNQYYFIIFITIGIIVLILLIILSYFFTIKLYNPIAGILKLFKMDINNKDNTSDELTFIKNYIKKLIFDKNILKNNLKTAFPIIIEHYITNILEDKNMLDEKEIMEFLEENNIHFKNPLFSIAAVRFDYNNEFNEKFSKEDQSEIINQTYKLFSSQLSDIYTTYILTFEKNMFYIILNMPENTVVKDIYKIIIKINKAYSFNQNYFDVFYGISRIHSGLSGLKISYKEANYAISSLSSIKKKRISIYNDKMINGVEYYYSINDENKLINQTVCGNINEAIIFIENIIKINYEKNVSLKYLKELLLQILSTGKRILYKKEISLKEIMKDKYIDIFQEYKNISLEKLTFYIKEIFKNICKLSNISKKSKINLDNIIDYINNNFQKDISLDIIAHENNVTIFHLSKILKNKLGMHFQDYINSLRIKKSKFLLIETNKTIDQISRDCGYNSRQNLIRIFKKLEGITPTKYRVMIKTAK